MHCEAASLTTLALTLPFVHTTQFPFGNLDYCMHVDSMGVCLAAGHLQARRVQHLPRRGRALPFDFFSAAGRGSVGLHVHAGQVWRRPPRKQGGLPGVQLAGGLAPSQGGPACAGGTASLGSGWPLRAAPLFSNC